MKAELLAKPVAPRTDVNQHRSTGGSDHAAAVQRRQRLADESPQVAALQRYQQMADGAARLTSAAQHKATANQTGLPDELKAGVEALSGLDISHVRVHTNSSRPAQLNALAFAQGSDIHLAPGQEKHLPHEAWHAVQQMQGRVRATTYANGAPVNADPGLEREADIMGAKSAQLKPLDPEAAAIAQPGPMTDHAGAAAQLIKIQIVPASGAAPQVADVPIQMVINFVPGQIALPRIYQNPFEPDQYVVTDFAGEDINYYTEINRMCNVMSITWALGWGAPGNVGFWGYGAADRLTMATWAAEDVSTAAQTQRAETILGAASIGVDNFGDFIRDDLDAGSAVRGVLASNVHAVAVVIQHGQVRLYDPMEGAVTFAGTIAAFSNAFAAMAEINEWNSAVINMA